MADKKQPAAIAVPIETAQAIAVYLTRQQLHASETAQLLRALQLAPPVEPAPEKKK